eukprot:gene8192-9751_t
MSNHNQAAAKKGTSGPAMEEADSALKKLLDGSVDVKTECSTLHAHLENLMSVYQARETQLIATVTEMRSKYALIIKEATDKASSIHAVAQKASADSAKNAANLLAVAKKTAADEIKTSTEKGQKLIADASAQAAAILAAAKKECEDWEAEKELVADIQKFKPVVKVNVGGTKFTTSLTTLCRFPDTMIGAMYSGRHELVQDEDGYHFIDRDGTHFRYILNFLRSPETFELDLAGSALKELKSECEYYGLEELMFPFTPIPPFSVNNPQNTSVNVVQDEDGIFTINDIPVRFCAHCLIGDYASDLSQKPKKHHGYYIHSDSGYYHYIQNLSETIRDKKGVIDSEQPKVVSPCRVCQN